MPSLVERLFGPRIAPVPAVSEPKRLLLPEVHNLPIESKASTFALLPKGAYGMNYTFFSPDGGRTMIDFADGPSLLAFCAYWYVATRWRAQKIAEAPLMVIKEDQKTGDEEWVPDHEIVPLLEEPSKDYDMGELLELTSHYLDNTGSALWMINRDRAERPAILTPFSGTEFTVSRDAERLFATFTVQTMDGPQDVDAENVCFFKDAQSITQYGKTAYGRSRSRLDVALSWLHLGERSRKTIHDLLANSVWPSIVVSPDKDWNPDLQTFEQYKQDLQKYSHQGNQGKPFVALGGAQVQQLSARIRDLVPSDVLNRVESVVAAISGVPAIVLQFEVGLQNSPWSQMAQARRMAYDDTIAPSWKKIERVLTKQLLRPMDEDPTHFIRFDSTNIDSLKRDQMESTQIAVQMGRAATLNERRHLMGLEPATAKQDPDKKADEIPELTQPSPMDLLAQGLGGGNAAPPKDAPGATDNTVPKPDANATDAAKKPDPNAKKHLTNYLERKFKGPALLNAFRTEAIPSWKAHAHALLAHDADEIASIVETYITEPTQTKSLETKARQKDRAMAAVSRYLNEDSRARWTKQMQPLMVQASQRGGAVIAADLNVSYTLMHPHILTFAKQTSGKMVTGVSNTTKDTVSRIIQGGLDANASTKEIANLIRESTGFSKERATLIARTETTKAFNGAPSESLAALSESTGRTFTKTWSGVLDDRERDEHVELEGETVAVDEVFSNGLDFPSEPNCRCTVLFNETS